MSRRHLLALVDRGEVEVGPDVVGRRGGVAVASNLNRKNSTSDPAIIV